MKEGDKVSVFTLEIAEKHLNAWLEAELAVSTGQSYRIGSRQLQRADLNEIRKQIQYWKNEVVKLNAKQSKKGIRRAIRIVPRDL